MTGYLYALADDLGPQAIPPGFGGHHDWDAIDDTERARRAWVREDAAPVVDSDWERLVRTPSKDADGVWSVAYSVAPVDLPIALASAFRLLATRAWMAEVGGMMFNGAPIPTDREVTQPRAISVGIAAQNDPDLTVTNWKLAPGVFLTLDNARLIELGKAMSAHVQARFDREAAISEILKGKRKVETLRAALAAEIDQGWPA